jgi:hypothetical protein
VARLHRKVSQLSHSQHYHRASGKPSQADKMFVRSVLILLLSVGAQLSTSATLDSTPRTNAVAALQKAFPSGQVVVEGTAAYEELNGSYLSRLNSDIDPAAIFLPSSAADVSKFVQIVSPYALANLTRVAVRGGGQQPDPACNNIEDGITIDLRNLSAIAVDTAAGSVAIGAGARWGSVYNQLEPLGLGVAGGRSGANGIGGLALAGKYPISLLSGTSCSIVTLCPLLQTQCLTLRRSQ